MPDKLEIRDLNKEDITEFISVKTAALGDHPEYFIDAQEKINQFSDEDWEDKLESEHYFGCFHDEELLGIIKHTQPSNQKISHTAEIKSFYIKPDRRGSGAAKHLFEFILLHLQARFEKAILAVHHTNKKAISLYQCFGFEKYGHDKKALKIDGVYHDEILMVKFFD